MWLIKPLVEYKENSQNFDKIEKMYMLLISDKKSQIVSKWVPILLAKAGSENFIFLNKHPRGTWSHV